MTTILLGLALTPALSFEFVNGFHDTANAVVWSDCSWCSTCSGCVSTEYH
ncbi:MAG: hypothetical protein WA825_17940 [Steroidobacteraceae bacterium]